MPLASLAGGGGGPAPARGQNPDVLGQTLYCHRLPRLTADRVFQGDDGWCRLRLADLVAREVAGARGLGVGVEAGPVRGDDRKERGRAVKLQLPDLFSGGIGDIIVEA